MQPSSDLLQLCIPWYSCKDGLLLNVFFLFCFLWKCKGVVKRETLGGMGGKVKAVRWRNGRVYSQVLYNMDTISSPFLAEKVKAWNFVGAVYLQPVIQAAVTLAHRSLVVITCLKCGCTMKCHCWWFSRFLSPTLLSVFCQCSCWNAVFASKHDEKEIKPSTYEVKAFREKEVCVKVHFKWL